MPSEIDVLLRRLHAPVVEPPEREAAAERELVARWAARFGSGMRSGEGESPGLAGLARRLVIGHRLAVACAALLLIVVAACVLPTSVDVPLGLSVEITTAGDAPLPHREIVELVRERSGAAEVEVFVSEALDDDGERRSQMVIRLWDQELAVGEIEPELREAFPVGLGAATIVETALEGEVEMIWGRRLAHRAFDVALREADIEDARAQLLIRLEAEGFSAEEVVVEIVDRPDGRREVQVGIERHGEPGELPLHEPGTFWVPED